MMLNRGKKKNFFNFALPIIILFGFVALVFMLGNKGYLSPTGHVIEGVGSGLIAYWNFDEVSGNSAADSSGNGKTATLVNGPTFTSSGKIGNAISFDGTNDYATVSVQTPSTYTISMWIYPTKNSGYQSLVAQDGNYALQYYADTSHTDFWYAPTDYYGSANVPVNTWTHFIFVNNNSAVTIYVNGQQDGSFSTSAPGMNIINIGRDPNGQYYGGRIDDLRVFNRVVSPSEIQELYSYTGGPDVTAPTISSPLPSGVLAYGTTSATISVATDESATCRYSTTNVDYALMANTFTTTGGTAHSATVSGLTNGGSYNYYARCNDTSGNVNTASTTISFSVNAVLLPTVSVSATDASAGEPSNPGAFNVTRSGVTTSALTVNYVISGSATNGVDYSTIANSVTIPIGSASATVTITPIDDVVYEGTEDVSLTISSNANYDIGSPSSATVTIADNDVAPPGGCNASVGNKCLYLLKSAAAGGNGLSWGSAWNELNQIDWTAVNPGDIIKVGQGTYVTSTTIPGNVGSSQKRVSIIHATDAGYNGKSIFDFRNTEPVNGDHWLGMIQVVSPYITIDGINSSLFEITASAEYALMINHTTSTGLFELKNVRMYGPSTPPLTDGSFIYHRAGSLVLDRIIITSQVGFEDFIRFKATGPNAHLNITNSVFIGWKSYNGGHSDLVEGCEVGCSSGRLLFKNNLVDDSGPNGKNIVIMTGNNDWAYAEITNNVFKETYQIFQSASVGTVKASNNVFYETTDANFGGSNNIYDSSTQVVWQSGVTYSLWTSRTPSFVSGTRNFVGNPSFKNVNSILGQDGIPFTADDGFNINSNSNAINNGTNVVARTTDILENPIDASPDIGAYEYQAPAVCNNCHYVRTGAIGANNGSDWANAWTTLPATLQRGHTYYIADGVYGGYTFDDALSGNLYIIVKKAIASDHGTETGWQSTYGDEQAIWGYSVSFTRGYYIFNGSKSTDGVAGSYGFKILPGNCNQDFNYPLMLGWGSSDGADYSKFAN